MSRRNEILIIASHSGRGLVHVDKLLPGLAAMGYKITFYGWDRNNEFPTRNHENGIEYVMIFRGFGFANKWLALALPLFVIKAFFHLIKLSSAKFPIIMAIDFDAALPQALALRFNKIPFLYNIRDNFAMRTTLPKTLRPIIKYLDEFVMAKSQQIIVPDENRITSNEKLDRKKIHVIHNGALDVSPPDILPKSNGFTVYAMGYLLKTRGIELLLNVAAIMPDIRILLAGDIKEMDLLPIINKLSNVDYRGILKPTEALKLCFESDVIFTFYDPVSEINRKAASNKWFDAMMAGKPILVNQEVERSSWIIGNDIGYSCVYGDVKELKKQIEYIRENPQDAERKGKNGRTLYQMGYSWDNSLKQFDVIIQKAIEN